MIPLPPSFLYYVALCKYLTKFPIPRDLDCRQLHKTGGPTKQNGYIEPQLTESSGH
jgi:hypothetical protein